MADLTDPAFVPHQTSVYRAAVRGTMTQADYLDSVLAAER
jgi:hypothetical protein